MKTLIILNLSRVHRKLGVAPWFSLGHMMAIFLLNCEEFCNDFYITLKNFTGEKFHDFTMW